MNLSFRPNQQPVDYPPQVILASQSIGRKTLLEKLGLRFRTAVTRLDEDAITDPDPVKTIKKRAEAKANEIIKNPQVYMIPAVGKVLIVTADSMAVIGKKTFGKAHDKHGAKEMLKALMGKTHTFTTALCLVYLENAVEKKRWESVTKTKVTMRKMTPAEVDLYIARYDFSRFAAAYALNETPWDLVTKIEGSYTNVIGLPFEELLPVIRKLEIIKPPANP